MCYHGFQEGLVLATHLVKLINTAAPYGGVGADETYNIQTGKCNVPLLDPPPLPTYHLPWSASTSAPASKA